MSQFSKRLDWTDEMVKRFWDHESLYPEHYFTKKHGANIVKRIYKYIQGRETVLDYGCGPGYLTEHLIEKITGEVYGLDFSPDSVESANHTFSHFNQFKGAYAPTHYIDNLIKFDAIVCVEMIEHLSSENLSAALNQMKRMMNDESILILTTPNNENLENEMVFCPKCCHEFHRWQHVSSWSRQSISELLVREGFEVIETFTTDFTKKSPLVGFLQRVKSFIDHFRGNLINKPHLVCIAKI